MSNIGILFVLLPIIVSGYLLYNTIFLRALLPNTYRSNGYFRILLLGFLWVLLCDAVLSHISRDSSVIKVMDGWNSLVFGQDVPLLESGLLVLLAIFIRIAADQILEFMSRSESVRHKIYMRILLNKDMDLMYYEAARHVSLLLITANNNKVYLGWVAKMGIPKDDRQWLHVFPSRSGYRDERKGLIFTTDYMPAQQYYSELLSKIKDKDLLASEGISRPMVLIAVKDIVAIQTFSNDIYEEFFQSDKMAA